MNKILDFMASSAFNRLWSFIFSVMAVVLLVTGNITNGLIFLLAAKGEEILYRLKELR